MNPNLAHPRYWPNWLGLGLMWLLARLPWHAALRVGECLGAALYYLAGRRRHIVQTNLRLCFPELSEAERTALAKENFRHTGRALAETVLAWWASDAKMGDRCTIRNEEHLRAAQAQGRGVLMLVGHFTCLEIASRFLTRSLAFDAVYRPQNNLVFERFSARYRNIFAGSAIPRDDVRGMLRRLKAGKVLMYLPDQDYGRRHAVFVPFFGIPAATITSTARLAESGNAVALPVFYYSRPGGRYEVVFGEPLADFPSGDPEADAARVNRVFEDAIREAPAQYLWVHRRFKTRPDPQMPSLY